MKQVSIASFSVLYVLTFMLVSSGVCTWMIQGTHVTISTQAISCPVPFTNVEMTDEGGWRDVGKSDSVTYCM